MAINKAGGPNFQQQINRAVMNDANTVSAQEGRQAMMTGGAGKLAEQNKKNQTTKTPGEQVKLSNAAMLERAKEAEAAEDVEAQSRANVADEATVQHRGKRELGDKDDGKKVKPGQVKGKDGTRVFPLDDDSGEAYEVTETQGKKLDRMDERSPNSLNADMPEGALKASEATLDTQIKTKGIEKVAGLKNNEEVSAVAEELDLDLADPEWKKSAAKPAPIQAPATPLEPKISAHDEELAKEAVQRKMASGEANEAMIA
ncbi:MAG: hypothetical protein KC800_04675 [Candidatus Eremiobacteraeota bacterium]|nr:hypothetical protein [Candidatus Eremiobacteraeota bacterium]